MIYTSKFFSSIQNFNDYFKGENNAPIAKKWHTSGNHSSNVQIYSKNREYSVILETLSQAVPLQQTVYCPQNTGINEGTNYTRNASNQNNIYIEAEANEIDICGYKSTTDNKFYTTLCNTEDMAIIFSGGASNTAGDPIYNNKSFVYIDTYGKFSPSSLEDYISAAAAMGLGDAAEYVIQPIFYAGKNTHLFSVTKNSDSVVFPIHTVIKLSGVEYFTVAPNIVVKAKEEA